MSENPLCSCAFRVLLMAGIVFIGLSPNSKHLTQLAKALEVNKSDFFIAPESPVPENVLLAEILKVAHDLSPQEQSLLLDIAYLMD